jgi:hypothetical protein
MEFNNFVIRFKFKWIVLFAILSSCVERIEFNVPSAKSQTVIEGMISDKPGPYMVKVSRALSLDEASSSIIPVSNATIRLYSDVGYIGNFEEVNSGTYITQGQIQGEVGRSYYITVETNDGKMYKSDLDEMRPVGGIEAIRFEFEERTVDEPFGKKKADVFNIFVDANGGTGDDNFVRWRFKGTYKVTNYPELHYTETPPYTPYKNPWPCSGYRIIPGPIGSGGLLEKFGDCTCCTCWVKQFESIPQLSDTELVSDNKFNNVKIGEVPINNATFHDKYLVEVEQMSLSRNSFEFFKLIRDQKTNASNLFQPTSGRIAGNINSLNNTDAVIGFFWATSIKQANLFIYPDDVPYPLPPIDFLTLPCYDSYPNSSSVKPANWE